jgi:hypothetical protein
VALISRYGDELLRSTNCCEAKAGVRLETPWRLMAIELDRRRATMFWNVVIQAKGFKNPT